ncbi:MAG TPA: TonB-dependent receptor [Chryseolinea sp.]|nr:TonB-dependent receptor [Chryseolinea sp.]
MRLIVLFIFLFIIQFIACAQRVSGTVYSEAGLPLPSAHIFLPRFNKSFATDSLGAFAFEHPAGSLHVEVSFTGYKKSIQSLTIKRDTVFHFVLESKTEQLDEVVISGEKVLQSDQFESTRSSVLSLSDKEINSIPVLGGEADLIKVIQLLPGVSKGVEGSTDLFVRGGAADQNLVLLDGAPVYNTGHLFGFLSVFNPDILQGVESINGAFPAQYGGRLSSILNVNTKSAMSQRTHVQGNIGSLASRLMIRQPIIKNKLDVWVAGRRTYIDQVVKIIGQSLPYYFYDINAKVIYRPSSKDEIEVTHYNGNDLMNYARERPDSSRNRNFTTNFTIANSTQTLLWNHARRTNVHSTLSLYRTRFNYAIENTFEDSRLFVNSAISDYGGKWILRLDSVKGISFSGGIEMVHHEVSPNIIDTSGEIAELLESNTTESQKTLETSLFVQADGQWGKDWSWSAGLRYSSAYVQKTLYTNPEPRFAMRYQWREHLALKASYSRMSQYLHRVSSAAVSFPTDIWYPVTAQVKPQTSDQYTLALQKVIPQKHLFISLEGYYKNMNQLIGYREGTNLFLNNNFEDQLIQGAGKAYGMELLIKKEAGKITGWVSYTLSRSQRQYDAINNGEWFLSRYDRRHNGSIVLNYEIAKRWSFSVVFEFISGSRFTPVIGKYVIPAPTLAGVQLIPVYSGMNAVKLADTHRLDLGVKFRSKPERKFQSEWFVGVYNVYNRATPYGISIEPNGDGSYRYEQPGLFGILPFISYGFKF